MTQSKFKIRRTFNLKNRGLILCGEILEGRIMVGDKIMINDLVDKLRIQGIEYIDFQGGYSEVGLVFSKPETDLLKDMNLDDLEIAIENGNTE